MYIDRYLDNSIITGFQSPVAPPTSSGFAEYFAACVIRVFCCEILYHSWWKELYDCHHHMAWRMRKKNCLGILILNIRIWKISFVLILRIGTLLRFRNAHRNTTGFTDLMGSWWKNDIGHGNFTGLHAMDKAAWYSHVMMTHVPTAPTLNIARQM